MKKWYNAFFGCFLLAPFVVLALGAIHNPTVPVLQSFASYYSDSLLFHQTWALDVFEAFFPVLGSYTFNVLFPLHWAWLTFVLRLVFDLFTIIPRMLQSLGRRWFKEDVEL